MPSGEKSGALRLPPVALPLIVIAAALLAGGGWLLITKQQQLEQTQAALEQTRQEVARLESEQLELSQRLKANENELKAREERLNALRAQLATASQDLEHSRQIFEDLKQQHETVVKDRDVLQSQVARATVERDEVNKRADRVEQGNQDLQRAVSRLRERLALLDRDYQKLSDQLQQAKATSVPTLNIIGAAGPVMNSAASGQSQAPPPIAQAIVELPPIIVRKDQSGMAIPVRGHVLEVNQPHNFLVMDKGSVDGVRVGMNFDVVRGAETVGRVSVVRVRPQLSACDIVRAKTPGPLQAGDLAVQSGP